MPKAATKQAVPPTPPLLPLEYCSPERAARLLGCELEDLFHWAAVGAINFYFEFSSHEYNPKFSNGFEALGASPDERIPCRYLNPITLDDITDYYSADNLEVYWSGSLLYSYGPEGFANGERFILKRNEDCLADQNVYLYGLWAISKYCIPTNQNIDYGNKDMLWDLTAKYVDDKNNDPNGVQLQISIDLVKVPDWAARLRVIREDLLKIQLHMISGEVMNKGPSSSLPKRVHSEVGRLLTDNLRPRTTVNQSKAIVELLKSHGYTDDDFKGSTEALQQKIARNGHSKQLHNVTAKTLRDWLDKGEAR